VFDQRLSGEQRRVAIVKAALPLFARKGFANTTTRELAEAAGVSEALIYKHFPSKESLYSEIQNTGCKDKDHGLEKLAGAEPSTSTLVHIVYYLVRSIVVGKPGDMISWETKHRMILNSCLEDGEFTRVLYESRFSCCFNKVQACLAAAEVAGDVVSSPISRENRVRFTHHLAAMIAINHLPKTPVLDYHVDREELLHQAVWFVLRGMGLTDQAIAGHYNPKALSAFFGVGSG
jgi:TetR/AcrR family transcriptional regulator, transcriptional repressor of aconitase